MPPETGGETPIVDCRRLFQVLDPGVRDPLVERGVRYVKIMHGGSGFGKSWQDHFETAAGFGAPPERIPPSPSQRRRARVIGRP